MLRPRTAACAPLATAIILCLASARAGGAREPEAPPPSCATGEAVLRLMTFNIRLDTPLDGQHAWPHRKAHVVSMVRFHEADVVGMQEVLAHQRDALTAALPDFICLGVGRDDGKQAGELCPLFIRRERFLLLDHGTFWLSSTPDVPGSRGWDAACNRIATWARLRERSSGRELIVLNTHLDHRGEVARREGARLVRERLIALAAGRLAFLLGDLNCETASAPFRALTSGGSLVDSASLSERPPHGPSFTFQGFDFAARSGPTIDFVLLRPDPTVRVLRQGTLSDHWDGDYPSDHFPVLAELAIRCD